MGVIRQEHDMASGKFIALRKLEYVDRHGNLRCWESADRVNGTPRNSDRPSAVLIIARIVPDNELLLVRQFRPPAGKIMVEFPAGLMDGDEAPEVTAVRELREETGYIGTVTSIIPQGYSSPGMTGETVYIAKMDVLEADQKELKTDFDEAEDIENVLVSPADLPDFIRKEDSAGHGIDIKVAAYAAVLS